MWVLGFRGLGLAGFRVLGIGICSLGLRIWDIRGCQALGELMFDKGFEYWVQGVGLGIRCFFGVGEPEFMSGACDLYLEPSISSSTFRGCG